MPNAAGDEAAVAALDNTLELTAAGFDERNGEICVAARVCHLLEQLGFLLHPSNRRGHRVPR
jgi:hypothetical protein